MVGESGDVELAARCLLRPLVVADAVQDILQDGQRRFGALQFIGRRGLRVLGPCANATSG